MNLDDKRKGEGMEGSVGLGGGVGGLNGTLKPLSYILGRKTFH